MAFTMVFDGRPDGPTNPLTTETPFGVARLVAVGDLAQMADIYRDALERISDSTGFIPDALRDIAEQAIAAGDKIVADEVAAARKSRKASQAA